jgi:hypothetical protein
MRLTVDVEIVPRGDVDPALLVDLSRLSSELVEAGLRIESSRTKMPGSKADLTLAISIAGLALSSISTLISVLTFWRSGQPHYTVTLKQGDTTYQVNNLGRDELREIGERIAQANTGGALVVGVQRG